MRTDNEDLSYKTKMALIDIILEDGADGKPFKLPNEDILSQQLGVSRNVLRDALMSLEEVGVVTRRRSKGTIANPKIATTGCRLDIGPELSKMITEAGYQVEIETIRLGFEFKPDPVFGEEQEAYLNVEKVFYADGIPAAYCSDHISGVYANRAKDSIMALKTLSHYKFLKQYCGTAMAYTMAHIAATLPPPWLQDRMQFGANEPVLTMDDSAYNYDHEIVAHSIIYFRSGVLDLKFLRKSW